MIYQINQYVYIITDYYYFNEILIQDKLSVLKQKLKEWENNKRGKVYS